MESQVECIRFQFEAIKLGIPTQAVRGLYGILTAPHLEACRMGRFFFFLSRPSFPGPMDRQLRVPNNCLRGPKPTQGGRDNDEIGGARRVFPRIVNNKSPLRGLDGVAKSRPSRRPTMSGHNNATLTKQPRDQLSLATRVSSLGDDRLRESGPSGAGHDRSNMRRPASTSSRQVGRCLLKAV